MSKVDLARRGILGLSSLLKKAPTENLPVPVTPSTPLQTLPQAPGTEQQTLEQIQRFLDRPTERRSVLKGIASRALPKLPLRKLWEITASAGKTPNPNTELLKEYYHPTTDSHKGGVWGGVYRHISGSEVMGRLDSLSERLLSRFTDKEIKEAVDYTENMIDFGGLERSENVFNQDPDFAEVLFDLSTEGEWHNRPKVLKFIDELNPEMMMFDLDQDIVNDIRRHLKDPDIPEDVKKFWRETLSDREDWKKIEEARELTRAHGSEGLEIIAPRLLDDAAQKLETKTKELGRYVPETSHEYTHRALKEQGLHENTARDLKDDIDQAIRGALPSDLIKK